VDVHCLAEPFERYSPVWHLVFFDVFTGFLSRVKEDNFGLIRLELLDLRVTFLVDEPVVHFDFEREYPVCRRIDLFLSELFLLLLVKDLTTLT